MEGVRERAVGDRQRMYRTCADPEIDVWKCSDSRNVHLSLSTGLFNHCCANSCLGTPIKQIGDFGNL
jgi:hypothetical protein